jgi:2-dehydropantoate 2-reductase
MTENKKLKVLCIGAGAIGTYVGGSLAVAGHEVHFLDRPETLKRIRENGIKLQLSTGNYSLNPNNLWDDITPALKINEFDFSILAVKSYDTDSVVDTWKEVADRMPPVVCFQNGVENEQKIRQIIGNEKTISGTITTAIGRIENGIVVEKLRGVGIENKNELSSLIIDVLNQAGLNAVGFENSAEMKWSKLLTNVTTNASCAILNMTPEEILNNPTLFKIEIEQLREVLKVMKGKNIRVVDLPGTPVKLFALVIRYFPLWLSRIVLKSSISKGRGGKMPSFYLDLVSGRMKSEVDYLNGAVVRNGVKAGIQTPVNKILTDTLMKLTMNEIRASEFDHQTEKYLNLFV